MSLAYHEPERYIGSFKQCYIGYAEHEEVRSNAASGGIVTAVLIHLLKTGRIQGALVSKQKMVEGKVEAYSFIATTEEEILDSRTSIYADFPLIKYFKEMVAFQGKLAIVALPCQISALKFYVKKYPELEQKIAFKISLFCSGIPESSMMDKILEKNSINPHNVRRVYFRKGHWRGMTHVEMNDGSEKQFSYLYNICTYKNLYYHFLPRCFSCSDHFGYDADLCCGDVWLSKMKKHPIKHTGMVAKTRLAQEVISEMEVQSVIKTQIVPSSDVIKSQKRSLHFKFKTAAPRKKWGHLFGLSYNGDANESYSVRHVVAAFFIMANIKMSRIPWANTLIFKVPRKLLFLYMCFIRFLLNK